MKIGSDELFDQLLEQTKKIVASVPNISDESDTNGHDNVSNAIISPMQQLPFISHSEQNNSTNCPPSPISSPLTVSKHEVTSLDTVKSTTSPLKLSLSPKKHSSNVQSISLKKFKHHAPMQRFSPLKLKKQKGESPKSLQDHKYSFEQVKNNIDSNVLDSDGMPCVSRSVFNNTVSSKDSLDIMVHQDKINILKQMSQVFNQEPEKNHLKIHNSSTVEPIKTKDIGISTMQTNKCVRQIPLDKLNSQSNVLHLPKSNHLNPDEQLSLNSSVPIHKSFVKLEKHTEETLPKKTQKEPNEDSPVTAAKNVDNSPTVEDIFHPPLYKVSHIPREEELKISVKSYTGEHGEDVDIIDGFTFMSYGTIEDMELHSNNNVKRKRPKSKLRNKKRLRNENSEEISVKDASKLDSTACSSMDDHSTEASSAISSVSPKSLVLPLLQPCDPDVPSNKEISEKPDAPISKRSFLQSTVRVPKKPLGQPDIRVPKKLLRALDVGIQKKVLEQDVRVTKRPLEQEDIKLPSGAINSKSIYNKPQPKCMKIAHGIPYDDDTLVKSCTYNKQLNGDVLKPNQAVKENRVNLYDGGRFVTLRGATPQNDNFKPMEILIPKVIQLPKQMKSFRLVEMNDSFAEYALSALASSNDKQKHTSNKALPAKKQNIVDILAAKLQIPGTSKYSPPNSQKSKSSDDIKQSLQMYNKNFTRFPSLSREMKRLNMNFVTCDETEDSNIISPNVTSRKCSKDFCSLGCICDSIECRPQRSTHCGKVKCMFECECDVESLGGNSTVKPVSIFELDRQYQDKLANKEKEFCKTVVESNNGVFVMGAGKRKRDIKLPERFRDSIFTDDEVNVKKLCTTKESVSGVPPSDYLKHIKKCYVEVPWFVLDKVKVWCMDHSCYGCVCLIDQFGGDVLNNGELMKPQILWLFKQPQPMPLSKCVPSSEEGHWLMKHWVHSSEHCARTCGYALKDLEYKRYDRDTIPECHDSTIMGVTFKRTSSAKDRKKMLQTKKPKPIRNVKPVPVQAPPKPETEKKKLSEDLFQQVVLHQLIAEEEQRGELELDLSEECGKTIVVTETRFRKLISMSMIGVTGMSKQGRCYIKTSKSSSDLKKMQRIHHLIGCDSLDVGPYMKEVFFPSQAESRTRYVILRCDSVGRWEIIGVVSKKAPTDTHYPIKARKPKPNIKSPPRQTQQLESFYQNEATNSELPIITSVMSACDSDLKSLLPLSPEKPVDQPVERKFYKFSIVPNSKLAKVIESKQDKQSEEPVVKDKAIKEALAKPICEAAEPTDEVATVAANTEKNTDSEVELIMTEGNSACCVVDMRIPFQKIRLHWVPGTIQRQTICAIFKLSFNMKVPIALKMKMGLKVLKFFGRSFYHDNNPIVLLGSNFLNVCNAVKDNSTFSSLFKGSTLKYYISIGTNETAIYRYSRKGTHLHLINSVAYSKCVKHVLSIQEAVHPRWQQEITALINSAEPIDRLDKIQNLALTQNKDETSMSDDARSLFLHTSNRISYPLPQIPTISSLSSIEPDSCSVVNPVKFKQSITQTKNKKPFAIPPYTIIRRPHQSYTSHLLRPGKYTVTPAMPTVSNVNRAKPMVPSILRTSRLNATALAGSSSSLLRIAPKPSSIPNSSPVKTITKETPSINSGLTVCSRSTSTVQVVKPYASLVHIRPLSSTAPVTKSIGFTMESKPTSTANVMSSVAVTALHSTPLTSCSIKSTTDASSLPEELVNTTLNVTTAPVPSSEPATSSNIPNSSTCDPVSVFSKDITAQLLMSTVNGNQKAFGIACYTEPTNDKQDQAPTMKLNLTKSKAKRGLEETMKLIEKKKADFMSQSNDVSQSLKDDTARKKVLTKTKSDPNHRSREHHNDAERLRRKAIGSTFHYLLQRLNSASDKFFKERLTSKKQILIESAFVIERLKGYSAILDSEEANLLKQQAHLLDKLQSSVKGTPLEDGMKTWLEENIVTPNNKKILEDNWKPGVVEVNGLVVDVDENGTLCISPRKSSKTSSDNSLSEADCLEGFSDSDVSIN